LESDKSLTYIMMKEEPYLVVLLQKVAGFVSVPSLASVTSYTQVEELKERRRWCTRDVGLYDQALCWLVFFAREDDIGFG